MFACLFVYLFDCSIVCFVLFLDVGIGYLRVVGGIEHFTVLIIDYVAKE